MAVISDADFFARLRGVIERGPIPLPDYPGYRGTGGPGLLLGRGLRDHGTKFRIMIDNLGFLYSKSQRFDAGAI